jgi:hypothetical protein
MAEIFRIKGYKFYIPSLDHDPAHVHVKKGDFTTRIDISGDRAVWMAGEESNPAAQDRKLRKVAITIANQNLIELKRRWEGIDRGRQ